MEAKLRNMAESAAGEPGKLAETFYRLQNVRSAAISDTELLADCTSLTTLGEKLRPLTSNSSECRHLTVLALSTAHLGKWPEDCDALLRAFPKAQIQLYVPENLK